MEEDAKLRARRYKEWEKKGQQQSSKEEDGVDSESKDENTEEEKTDKKKESAMTDSDKAWNELDDHDKRKEYKRARKVLDSLKATRKTEDDE